jgi:transglutaminase-like putative cysteine protease
LRAKLARATAGEEGSEPMRFHVVHESLYRYSAPVEFTPHLLRLNPRPEGVSVLSRDLTVTPQPVESVDFVDGYGNRLTRVAFAGFSSELRIVSRFSLDTLSGGGPPGDAGLLARLPWRPVADGLEPYRGIGDVEEPVQAFAQEVAARASYRPEIFFPTLCRTIFEAMDRGLRFEGAAQSAATTLALRSGACRDLTVLFLAACRSLGIPARFVSGYQARAQTPDGQRHLHAWAEVFRPGLGWAGWDPMHGVPVGDGHVALCAAPEQAATMPVEGAYYGPARTATLDTSVRIATE